MPNTSRPDTNNRSTGQVSRREFIATGIAMGAVLGTGGLGLLSQVAHAEVQPRSASGVDWYSAEQWGVEGKGWTDTESYYHRLPARAKNMVRTQVWNLSLNSSGMVVHFATDSTEIHSRWNLNNSRLAMPHMAATGVSGVDLYAMNDAGEWRWLAVGQPDVYPLLQKQLISGIAPGFRRYMLYLPLYNGVTFVEIGVSQGARFEAISPRTEEPIVFYGSSIVHGACASRPGMPHPAILGRRLDRPIINLGFSGNAKMEPEIATLLAELDPVAYVLDALPNMVEDEVASRAVPFIRIIRAARPRTPIVLVEDRAYTNTPFIPSRQLRHEGTRRALRGAYEQLTAGGDRNLYFVPRDNLFGTDAEGSVDSSHPSDLGFFRMADVLEPLLRTILM